jgi:hypothetical protein
LEWSAWSYQQDIGVDNRKINQIIDHHHHRKEHPHHLVIVITGCNSYDLSFL